MNEDTDDWSQYLESALFAINTSIQSATKFTPFRMMFGRQPVFPLEAEKQGKCIGLDDMADSLTKVDVDNYVQEVFQKQQTIFQIADERIKESQKKQKELYKRRKGLTDHVFKTGSMVLRRNMKQKTRKGSKNEDRWLGPYTIVDLSKTSCHLKNASGKQLKAHININQLKPYHCYPSAIAGTSDRIVKKYYHTCSSFILGTSSHLHGVKPSEDSSGIKSSKRRKNSDEILSLLLSSGNSISDNLDSIPPSKKQKKSHEIESPLILNECRNSSENVDIPSSNQPIITVCAVNSKKSLHDSEKCFPYSNKAHQKPSVHQLQQSKLQIFASTAVSSPNVQLDKVKMVTMDSSSLHLRQVIDIARYL